ncbi:MAG: 6-carboxytetrahydropterin synthase [Elusimicrobia bacterium]|nr:6-carboxytetrahydropterin synthase [Elusimicrobiota bacterium]
MAKYRIKKTFHVAYGHRLLNYKGKCENLHGHNGLIEVTLEAPELNGEKMVADFTEIGRAMKDWLDGSIDHKVVLAKNDPLAGTLAAAGQACYLTDDNPTAETLARLVYKAARDLGFPAAEAAFWETPTSMASYSE